MMRPPIDERFSEARGAWPLEAGPGMLEQEEDGARTAVDAASGAAEAEDGLAELRRVPLPASFVAAVMSRVDGERPRVGILRWLVRPRRLEFRLSPLGGVAIGMAMTAILTVVVTATAIRSIAHMTGMPATAAVGAGRQESVGPAGQPAVADREAASSALLSPVQVPSSSVSGAGNADAVMVRFVLVAKGAQRVTLAGDFNGWSTDATPLVDQRRDGRFVATVPLPRGDHRYMFVVDGQWQTDPTADLRRPDGFGGENAVLRL